MSRLLPCLALICLGLAALPAAADGAGPIGVDRSAEERIGARDWPAPLRLSGPRPARRVTGGPDYVGSEYGLARPAYSGIGTRPDWGRSSVD